MMKFITGNAKKVEEFQQIIGSSLHVEPKMLDLPELQGEPEDIAMEKCVMASKLTDGPIITEDTCLCFNALGGLPGPYIKWFLQKTGHIGLNNLLMAYEDKSAYALCIFAYFDKSKMDKPMLFEGKTEGTIVTARGPNSFGWDPIFQPNGYDLTYAQLDKDIKNKISHRGKALNKLKDYLLSHH